MARVTKLHEGFRKTIVAGDESVKGFKKISKDFENSC